MVQKIHSHDSNAPALANGGSAGYDDYIPKEKYGTNLGSKKAESKKDGTKKKEVVKKGEPVVDLLDMDGPSTIAPATSGGGGDKRRDGGWERGCFCWRCRRILFWLEGVERRRKRRRQRTSTLMGAYEIRTS